MDLHFKFFLEKENNCDIAILTLSFDSESYICNKSIAQLASHNESAVSFFFVFFFSRSFSFLPKCSSFHRSYSYGMHVRNAAAKWQRSRNLYYKSECNYMRACRQVPATRESRQEERVRFISVVFQFSCRCERVSKLLSCNFYSAKIGNKKMEIGTKITGEI